MATHSSIVAWRIPWAEEPGRLQSIGLQRVGHEGLSAEVLQSNSAKHRELYPISWGKSEWKGI